VLIENLIDHSLFPLKSSDSAEFVMETFLSMNLEALPVVDDNEIKGFIESSYLLDKPSDTLVLELVQSHPSWVINEKQYYFEAYRSFMEFKAGCMGVVDDQNIFKGVISKSSAINYLASANTQKAEGGVICINMLARSYSLNELTRIIENDDAKILGLSIFNIPDSSRIMIHLKLNTIFTDRIISALQRFEFEVVASFYHNNHGSDFENRYNSLLKYLEF